MGKEFKDFADAEIIRPLYIWGLVGVTCAIGVTHMLAAILGVVGTLGENKRCAVQTVSCVILSVGMSSLLAVLKPMHLAQAEARSSCHQPGRSN